MTATAAGATMVVSAPDVAVTDSAEPDTGGPDHCQRRGRRGGQSLCARHGPWPPPRRGAMTRTRGARIPRRITFRVLLFLVRAGRPRPTPGTPRSGGT